MKLKPPRNIFGLQNRVFPSLQIGLLLCALCVPVLGFAQQKTTTNRDSVRYTRLKQTMTKSAIGREVYNFLFRDVYNGTNSQEISKIAENPFVEHEGKVIRKISIKRLQVFGESVYDTTRKAKTWFDKGLNALHTDTREGVIRNSFLLFQEGDVLRPNVVWDNERLLRSTSIFHDARILVLPDSQFPNLVDVLILTQDVWSLEPVIDIGGVGRYNLGLSQRNFRGLGHRWDNLFYYNKTALPTWEYQTRYTVPYIGRSYITTEVNLTLLREFKQLGIRAYRPFITPETKWAGEAELNRNETINYVFYRDTDSLISFPLNYNYADAWVGRAFKLKGLQERSRIVLAARASRFTYTQRPTVTADTNRLYSNRGTYLFNIGFSNRQYRRDVLVYGYGRTEDVPYGYLATLVGGVENTEFGKRTYLGLKLAKGQYLKNNNGYLYTLLNVGGFRRNGSIEQGVISAEANYFSPIVRVKGFLSKFRHFATLRYTQGINRFDYEYLSISNNGIRGLSSDRLRGTQKLTLSLESVCFTPASIAGFRAAVYGFTDLGWVNFNSKSLINNTLYQGYGIGIRLRNENLTFNTVSLRIGYYPTIPNASGAFRGDASGEQVLRLQDFTIAAPEVVPFR